MIEILACLWNTTAVPRRHLQSDGSFRASKSERLEIYQEKNILKRRIVTWYSTCIYAKVPCNINFQEQHASSSLRFDTIKLGKRKKTISQ